MDRRTLIETLGRWKWVALYAGLIYSTLGVMPAVRNFAADTFGPTVFTWVAGTLLGVTVLGALAYVVRTRLIRGFTGYANFTVIALVYTGLLVVFGEIPVEQIHVIQYGLMGVLVYMALDKDRSQRALLLRAVGIVFVLGAVDEVIQEFLPNRYFDVRDIVMNGVSGLVSQLAILVARGSSYSAQPPVLMFQDPQTGSA